MIYLDQLRACVATQLQQTDLLIRTQLHSTIPFINELTDYILKGGGKRLRPLLVLLTADMFGYTGDTSISLAAIIEFIHTATLLHDDVVDASTLRRGRQTINAIWGNASSVLVGDFLYSRAFQLATTLNNIHIIDVLVSATNQIAEGEVLQLTHRGSSDTTEAQYYQIIENKTAKLFEVAAELGAIISQRSQKEIIALRTYGKHLGIAYQLIDDALDYSGQTELLGKNIGDDLAEGKMTLPLLHVLQYGSDAQRALVHEAIQTTHHSLSYLDAIQTAVTATGAVEYTINAAQQQINRAMDALTVLADSLPRDHLIHLATLVIEREQ